MEKQLKQIRVIPALAAAALLSALAGCATETSNALPVQKVETANKPYNGAHPDCGGQV